MATITKTDRVEEKFVFDKHELNGEPGSDDTRQIQCDCLVRGLVDHVRGMANKHTESAEERNLIEMEVAMKLLESFQINARAEVLRARFLDRKQR